MSKIVQAVNAMIANPDLITNVRRGGSEIFFLYKAKYKWSIAQRGENYLLWFYPCTETIEQLLDFVDNNWEDVGIEMVTYSASEIGTKEARASFSELYTLVSEKYLGVSDMLDDIISDVIPIF